MIIISKKLLIIAAIGAIFSGAANSESMHPMSDKDKYSLKGYVGADFYKKFKTDSVVYKDHQSPKKRAVYGVALGYKINHKFSADVDFSFREPEYKYAAAKQRINTYALFLDGNYEIMQHNAFAPYITAGIGYSIIDPENLNTKFFKKANNIAFNAGIGTKCKINHTLSADFNYKYVVLGKYRDLNKALPKQRLDGHQVSIGLVYKL